MTYGIEPMSHYQKIIITVVRLLGVFLMLRSLSAVSVALVLSRPMWKLSLIGAVPMTVGGLVLFFIAAPLAKAVTWGFRDD